MKKVIYKIFRHFVWFFLRLNYRVKFGFRKRLNRWIIKTYQQQVRKTEFLMGAKEVRVKKGKIRYTCLYFMTPKGQVRINLGRHFRGRNFFDQLNQQWI